MTEQKVPVTLEQLIKMRMTTFGEDLSSVLHTGKDFQTNRILAIIDEMRAVHANDCTCLGCDTLRALVILIKDLK